MTAEERNGLIVTYDFYCWRFLRPLYQWFIDRIGDLLERQMVAAMRRSESANTIINDGLFFPTDILVPTGPMHIVGWEAHTGDSIVGCTMGYSKTLNGWWTQ